MAQYGSKQWLRESIEKLTKEQKTKITRQFNNKNYIIVTGVSIKAGFTEPKAKRRANIEARRWRDFNNKAKVIRENNEFIIYVEIPPPSKPISKLAQKTQYSKGLVHVKGHRRKATNVRSYTRRKPRR